MWYDDQREVHRQIFEADETIDYAFMGQDPDAADNRWLREAFEHRIPIIYFLGIAPGCTVKLTKSSSIDPQDTGLKPAVNPAMLGIRNGHQPQLDNTLISAPFARGLMPVFVNVINPQRVEAVSISN